MISTSSVSTPRTISKQTLLQSGGEGAIYVRQDKAIKIYHQPTAQRSEKLKAFLSRHLSQHLPSNVLGPQRLVSDARGRVTGFEMALLPETARPWKKLTQLNFSRQHALDLQQELALLLALHRDLRAIHAAGLVVGDLNDHNIFVDLPLGQQGMLSAQAKIYWIDVDSYQFAHFPCPVALTSFLDPRLYGVADFSTKPVFSQESDWYAFAVLMYKTLLKTHPFGGAHPQLKTLQARAEARISILHPTVIYPKAARPPTVVHEPMLAYLRQVFEDGQRNPPSVSLLQTLMQSLTRCPRCDETYAASRPRCPYCRRQTSRVKPAKVSGALRIRPLLQTSGIISGVFVRPSGRMFAVTRQGTEYRLLYLGIGGVVDNTRLFSGPPGARFALFENVLVVNPPARRELFLIDIHGGSARPLTSVDSERFDGTAVFAATPTALYRLANGYVLRGRLRRGDLLEDVISTAHRYRTQLWASRYDDRIAGAHLLFNRHSFFIMNDGRHERQASLMASRSALAGPISALDVAWGRRNVAFMWHEKHSGSLSSHVHIVDHHGQLQHHDKTTGSIPPFDRLDGKLVNGTTLLHPTDGGILKVNPHSQSLLSDLAPFCSSSATLYWHPRGVLIQEAKSLLLAEQIGS